MENIIKQRFVDHLEVAQAVMNSEIMSQIETVATAIKKALAEGKIIKREESEYKHHTYQTHKRSAGAHDRKFSNDKRKNDNKDGNRKTFEASRTERKSFCSK